MAFEEEAKSKKRKRKPTRHMACVVGAVMCAVSFLESAINGLFGAAQNTSSPTEFDRELARRSGEVRGHAVLGKYVAALKAAGLEGSPKADDPYASVRTLILLRNFIAHPSRLVSQEDRPSILESRLRRKYAFDSRRERSAEFFPDRCLSPDCSVWAVVAAAQFFLQFLRRLPAATYTANGLAKEVRAILAKAERLRRKHEGPWHRKRWKSAQRRGRMGAGAGAEA